tara:strand:+ start:320 stop:1864 length:1545 start_codon:yes stop_codon:yes gene_type:complete
MVERVLEEATNKSRVKQSDIKALMKTVVSGTMQAVSKGRELSISPTVVRNITKDIVKDFESGSVEKFENAMDRTEKVVEKLGVNIKDFNKGLAKRIEELKNQRDRSAKEVEVLRAKNIVAETRTIKEGKEFKVETNILTKQEIENRKTLLKENVKRVDDFEEKIIKRREKLLENDKLTTEQKDKIISDEKKLQGFKEKIEKEDTTLNPLKEQEDSGPQSAFLEELKAPFMAFGDALMGLKEGVMQGKKVFDFFSKGGLMKSLKSFRKSIKVLGTFFKSTRVLIGLAIVGVVAAIFFFRDKIGAVADFLVSIPEKIGNFFKKAFTTFTDFFKTAVNSVIMLIRKVPGFKKFGTLMETSTMKADREEKEKAERIKKGEQDFDSIGTESGFEKTESGLMKPKFEFDKGQSFDDTDAGNASSVVFDPNTGEAKILNRQVVGDNFKGAGGDGTGDASVAKTLYQEQKQSKMFDTGEVPPAVIYNNQTSTVGGSNSTVSGFINNKNVDNTFLNLDNDMSP